jgi:hypothetical protein
MKVLKEVMTALQVQSFDLHFQPGIIQAGIPSILSKRKGY